MIAKSDPAAVRLVIDVLRGDSALYVKKSVANVLRNASAKHPAFVLALCNEWAREDSPHTRWIVKDGLRKLLVSHPREAETTLAALRQ